MRVAFNLLAALGVSLFYSQSGMPLMLVPSIVLTMAVVWLPGALETAINDDWLPTPLFAHPVTRFMLRTGDTSLWRGLGVATLLYASSVFFRFEGQRFPSPAYVYLSLAALEVACLVEMAVRALSLRRSPTQP